MPRRDERSVAVNNVTEGSVGGGCCSASSSTAATSRRCFGCCVGNCFGFGSCCRAAGGVWCRVDDAHEEQGETTAHPRDRIEHKNKHKFEQKRDECLVYPFSTATAFFSAVADPSPPPCCFVQLVNWRSFCSTKGGRHAGGCSRDGSLMSCPPGSYCGAPARAAEDVRVTVKNTTSCCFAPLADGLYTHTVQQPRTRTHKGCCSPV